MTLGYNKRTPAEASALSQSCSQIEAYIFSEHFLAVASHTPPALSQLALSVAFVTSPAKAGPVKESATANANIETRVFMKLTPHNNQNDVPGSLSSVTKEGWPPGLACYERMREPERARI